MTEALAIMFLACWLEYHTDIPAAAAFARAVIAERTQRAREFGIRWRSRWYSPKVSDRLHEISMRASPFLERLKNERAQTACYFADPSAFQHVNVRWP